MKYAAHLRQRFREARCKRTRVLTFDRETTIGKYMGRKASPFDPMNWIVATGWKYLDEKQVNHRYYNSPSEFPDSDEMPIDDVLYLVGFNIKFDLLWKWNDPEFRRFRATGGKIWDCQLAQYLLTGQIMNMKAGEMSRPSMNNVARRMGLGLKIDEVKKLWDQGIDTSDINKDLLLSYLCGSKDMNTVNRYGEVLGDVLTTEEIFKAQVKKARELGCMPLLEARMQSLMCTTEMEYNGLSVDVKLGEANRIRLTDACNELWENLECEVSDLPFEFNWGSSTQLGALLFGGDVKYKVQKPHPTQPYFFKEEIVQVLDKNGSPVIYQSGKKEGEFKTKKQKVYDLDRPKLKWFEEVYSFPGLVEGLPEWKTKKGSWKTDADTLDEVVDTYEDQDFIEILGIYRWLDKDLGTYYKKWNEKKQQWKGMLTLVQPDGFIHHSLNHCVTKTGRQSSSNPNCQNLPRGDKSVVKQMFRSRFGNEGVMMEIDFGAIEVVVKAMLASDRQLIEDLMAGVDMHTMRLSLVTGEDYDLLMKIKDDESHPRHKEVKSARQNIKGYSFSSQYGAGLATMAANCGLTKEKTQELQNAEKARYNKVTDYEESVFAAIEASARNVANVKTKNGYPAKRGKYTSPFGSIYTFTQIDAPSFLAKRGIYTNFYKPEMMNFPTQGDAGVVVQVAQGKLMSHFSELYNYEDKAFLVNTVHDCVWLDVHKSVADQVAHDIKRIMENVPRYLNEIFGMYAHVPFPADLEVGPNMYELHGYHDYDYESYPTPHTSAWPEEYGQTTVAYYDWDDNPIAEVA